MKIVSFVNQSKATAIGDTIAVADTSLTRFMGLMGKRSLAAGSGLWITPSSGVHTFWMRMSIDVATCIPVGRDGYRVVRVLTVPPRRVTRPAWRASVVLEAEAGSFRRWDVRPGDKVEVR